MFMRTDLSGDRRPEKPLDGMTGVNAADMVCHGGEKSKRVGGARIYWRYYV